ncbi:CPBP family intramembrane glutamic endopeptidase [Lentilactobacillus farraginis]|uniref:CPBP family intramembrane glutamic endopeptidase n=1 Tax=Lentilactobacillus farraginis TaxID=390841 RepID=UPI000555116D|nr:CPBP family intramembrane glutamic endopeptidase [Lentilactobacillus farraginis]
MIIENRWSWGRQITLAIGLFLVFNALSMYLYNAALLDYTIAEFGFALLSFAITFWALKSTKVFTRRLSMTRPLIIWGLIALVMLVIVFIFAQVPQHIVMVFQAKHFLVNTLIALSAAIFEESICRGLFLSAFLVHAEYNSRTYKMTRSAVYSSFLFGVFHLVNLMGNNPAAVFEQIFWAFVLGVFFSALRFTTNSLWWGILLHFLLDWFPSAGLKSGITATSWGIILAVFAPLLVASIIYLVKADQAYESRVAHGAVQVDS